MKRSEAIDILCKEEIKKLTIQNREDILSNWWGINEDDDEFHILPAWLQNELLESEDIPEDVGNKKYDPLIIEALKYDYIGVMNEYIGKRLSELLGIKELIEGDAESLFACPCCFYKTLDVRGEYSVCPVCLWEDDGNDEHSLDRYSSPNHMTLAEARNYYASKRMGEAGKEIERYYK